MYMYWTVKPVSVIILLNKKVFNLKRCSNFYLRLSCFHWCSNSERNIQTFQLTTFTIHICCNEWIEWDKMKSISMFACTSPLDEEEKNQLVWREEVKKTVVPGESDWKCIFRKSDLFFFLEVSCRLALSSTIKSYHIHFLNFLRNSNFNSSIPNQWLSSRWATVCVCVCDWRT